MKLEEEFKKKIEEMNQANYKLKNLNLNFIKFY